MNSFLKTLRYDTTRCGVALFVFAAAVRLIYVAQGYEVPPQDTRDYDDIALNLLAGEGFVARENWFGYEVRSWRAPFYPLFLAAVYGVAGHSHDAVRIVQCFVGAGTVVFVYLIACHLRQRSAWVPAMLAAIYGPLVSVSNEVMTETWFCLLQTAGVYCLLRSANRDSDRWRALGGVAVGLGALTRPVGLLMLPAYVAYEMWRGRDTRCRSILVVTAAVLLVTIPWTIRNYNVHGAWPVFSTHGGFILARSNGPDPDWRRAEGWRIARETFELTPSEIERDRMWFRQGVSLVVENPARYLRWSIEKFVRFWYFFRPDYNVWFVTILPFFLLGLFRYGAVDGYRLLSILIVMSVATYSLVLYGSTRFRLPLEPLFLLFASAWCVDYVTRRGKTAMWMLSGFVVLNLILKLNEEPLRSGMLSVLRFLDMK